MIKMKELKKSGLPVYRFSNRKGQSMEQAQTAVKGFLEEANKQYELPVRISCDEVKLGGVFSGSASCLLIQNTEHPWDYFQYCLVLQAQGNVVLMDIWYYGRSPLAEKATKGKLDGLGGAIKNSIFGTKDQWQEEAAYYKALNALIAEAAR